MVNTSNRTEVSSSPDAGNDRLTSEDLAALIIDAFLRAGVMKKDDVERALKIAVEEIDARKAMGDYQMTQLF